MSYIDTVADWIEMRPEIPDVFTLYRATASLDTLGAVTTVALGLRQRQQRETALAVWADDGGRA